jgi:hypothetical protein
MVPSQEIPEMEHVRACSWRCHACDSLLGVLRGGELQLKYRDTEYRITGGCRCDHACRRCGATNVLQVPVRGTEGGGR